MSKPRIWEDALVEAAVKHCLQIVENIEHLANTSQTQPYDMPPSLVPTDLLYNLAMCFQSLYADALKKDLTETGNIKTTKNIH